MSFEEYLNEIESEFNSHDGGKKRFQELKNYHVFGLMELTWNSAKKDAIEEYKQIYER